MNLQANSYGENETGHHIVAHCVRTVAEPMGEILSKPFTPDDVAGSTVHHSCHCSIPGNSERCLLGGVYETPDCQMFVWNRGIGECKGLRRELARQTEHGLDS